MKDEGACHRIFVGVVSCGLVDCVFEVDQMRDPRNDTKKHEKAYSESENSR